jgi:hypothetical protein
MNGSNVGARTKGPTHTFMGDDDSLLFRADENSQSGSSFPESGTSLQSVVSHHVTHATHAAIGKEDSGGISHCEHSLSSRLSSLRALCVPAPRDTHKIPQRRRFKSRRPHQGTHTHDDGSNLNAGTTPATLNFGYALFVHGLTVTEMRSQLLMFLQGKRENGLLRQFTVTYRCNYPECSF